MGSNGERCGGDMDLADRSGSAEVEAADGAANALPSIDVAARVRALIRAPVVLLVDDAGPHQPTPVPGRESTILRQSWSRTRPGSETNVTQEDSSGQQPPTVAPDDVSLVVCDERGARRGTSDLDSLSAWLSGLSVSASIALVTDGTPDRAGWVSQPEYAGRLASRGLLRVFDQNLRLAGVGLALYKRTTATLPDIVQRYEEALAADRGPGSVGPDAGGIRALEDQLRDRDRVLGLVARLLSAQDEADYWRARCETAGSPPKEMVRAARAQAVERAVAEVKRSRRYRVGSAMLGPIAAARRMAGRARSAK